MAKKLLYLLVIILIATGLSGCSDDKEAAQKEAKMQQLLNQKTEKNARIERWKVVEITPSSSSTRIVKIAYPNTDMTKTVEIEGHDDLEVGMDVIIEIKVTDLSMNKLVDSLKNREFIKILYY
ncbi:MAG: hypothetical protein COX19_09755 [Desulfobacterales bacterium CG23_combo_of_CG06-09_8_20_14_all_51_8]|nr:MAG: hypothetical protein COX19_09755 [Desulfobacterales bacterium CG23_combo_of_CG06-09_8_20_14_all_51_8]